MKYFTQFSCKLIFSIFICIVWYNVWLHSAVILNILSLVKKIFNQKKTKQKKTKQKAKTKTKTKQNKTKKNIT